ncbi:MAG: NAD(P)/FAD-dependent oxidoreductase, partial [Prevotellamassilia sp.]|nr:NAD(P)/FAD-dependent oxidoreductase [Prevotellamassilia sp.]
LAALDSATLESKTQKGLFFAGEVTDVDGVTGGFNLQAAWTMAEVVARAVKG